MTVVMVVVVVVAAAVVGWGVGEMLSNLSGFPFAVLKGS